MIAGLFACPHCSLVLVFSETSAACANGHNFDRARDGYFNLLVVGRQAAHKVAGDTADALTARRRFLSAHHYQPISAAVSELIGHNADAVLDVGCGEGHYTAQLPAQRLIGLDISKTAVRMAARKYPAISFVVGSSYRLPILPDVLSGVVSIFAQRPYPEFRRVLGPDGVAVTVSPAARHLIELSADSNDRRLIDRVRPPIEIGEATRLTFVLELDSSSRDDLVQMTPLFWQRQARASLASGVDAVTVDVWVSRVTKADLAALAQAR